MEVNFEVCLEEDPTSAMNILTTFAIDSFNARSSTPDSEKHNEKHVLICEHCKKQRHTKEQQLKIAWSSLKR